VGIKLEAKRRMLRLVEATEQQLAVEGRQFAVKWGTAAAREGEVL
jgi:hypothetical protein